VSPRRLFRRRTELEGTVLENVKPGSPEGDANSLITPQYPLSAFSRLLTKVQLDYDAFNIDSLHSITFRLLALRVVPHRIFAIAISAAFGPPFLPAGPANGKATFCVDLNRD